MQKMNRSPTMFELRLFFPIGGRVNLSIITFMLLKIKVQILALLMNKMTKTYPSIIAGVVCRIRSKICIICQIKNIWLYHSFPKDN